MDSQLVKKPAEIRPIPDAVPTIVENTLRRCPGHKGACVHSFVPGSGFVPDLATAYEQMRGTAVDPKRPLSRTEALSLELCFSCSHGYDFKRYGVRMYLTKDTLTLMAQWATRNIQEKEEAKLREREFELRQSQRRLAEALNNEDKSFINQTFDRIRPRDHGFSHRTRQYKGNPKPRRDPNAPKKFGDEHKPKAEDSSTKRKKKSKGGDDKKKQKKGR